MNISALSIYLWQLVDNIPVPATIFVALSVVAFIISSIYRIFTYSEVERLKVNECSAGLIAEATSCFESTKKIVKLSATILIISLSLKIFVPSSNTIAMMIVLPEIAKSKVIQQDLPDIYNAAIEALKAAIKPPTK